MLYVFGFDDSNNKYELGSPIAFVYNNSVFAPASSVHLKLLPITNTPELHSIQVFDNATLFFEGIVDKQTVSIGKQFDTFSIYARSFAALLIDNEFPVSYSLSVTPEKLFRAFAEPYFQFKGILYSGSPKMPLLQVSKGMSPWQIIELFAKRTANTFPIMTEDGYIDIRPEKHKTENYILLSNNLKNAIPFSSLDFSINRSKIISAIYKIDENNNIQTLAYLNKKRKIMRERYVRTDNDWQSLATDAGVDILQTLMDKNTFNVTLPDFHAIRLFDRITIDCDFHDSNDLFVGEISITQNKDGFITILKLFKSKYIDNS